MGDFRVLASDIRRLKKEIVKAVNRATEKTAKGAVLTAQYYSGGRYSSYMLASLGHPYSTRQGPFSRRFNAHVLPYGDAAIINRQSGEFQRDWIYTNIRLANGTIIRVVKNTAPYAKFLETGTHRMIARPIDRLIKQWIDNALPVNLEREVGPVFAATLSG